MRSQNLTGSQGKRLLKGGALATVAILVLTGCSEQVQRGWLPGSRDTTNHTAALTDLWVGSWVTALIVGLIAWGLMLWCMVAYRRRKNDVGFPRQTAYNMPIETMFTIMPIIIVFVLWGFSDRVQRQVDTPVEDSPLVVTVYGKQWAWDFDYEYDGEERHYFGTQAHLTGEEGVEETLPTMYLPADVPVEFRLKTRDVIHSFWIPAFLQKLDMIPGQTNHIYLTPQEEGIFQGKCAELCGEYHSEMLFNVEVVSEQEFRDELSQMPEGLTGNELNRNPNENEDGWQDQEVPLGDPERVEE
ncbi:aa3-type cytochrome oxidase subunit II [Citricoccus sp. NR2]|uniref:aa3-type cytochrome oxidase subunit II n=1 Tax=Citricoccus sp. NR2 TaxID=3004095 RepID=UPI0022DDFCF8|nr:cytochrome c oxidase subunit II [Citricoccus sp. NR2]WBL18235.1 cytochrome c oxidase subunit II [Citricoccus sp. NR2]